MVKTKKITIMLIAGVMFLVSLAFIGGCASGADGTSGGKNRDGHMFKDDFVGPSISRDVPLREVD